MKSNYRIQSLLATLGAWSLLLAMLFTFVGCDAKKPGGEDTPSEEHTTARQPSANDFPSAPDLDDPNDEILNNGGNEDSSTTEKPAPVAPPALVTNRFAGQGTAGVASGTFYNGDHWFYATVMDVNGDTIAVQPYKNAEERQVADRILIDIAHTTQPEYTVPTFYKGSLIMVVYDGVITPGTPPKILTPARFVAYVHGFGGNGVDYFCAGAYKIGYFSNEGIYNSRLNQSGEGQRPVYHITSVAELKELLDLFALPGVFDPQIKSRCYMEDFLLSTYGEEYFAENDLVVAYFTESSGSYRLSVEQVTVKNGILCMTVKRVIPEVFTCDIAGWFATVEVAKEAMAEVSSFSLIAREVSWREDA